MQIDNFKIINFKSIKELDISLSEYGKGARKSKTAFLVGINESGKSAILEALSLLNKGFSGINYDDYCFLESQEDNKYVEIYVTLTIKPKHIHFYRKQIAKIVGLPDKFTNKIEIKELAKNLYLRGETASDTYMVTINSNLPYYQYIVNTTSTVTNGKTVNEDTIEVLKEFNDIKDDITKENADSFLNDNQKLLTRDYLESEISEKLRSLFNHNLPKVQSWKSSSEYLINDIIDLESFKEDTSISVPLRNIFNIYGKKSDKEIQKTIERALSNQARADELQDKISAKVTRHINKIWKEHKIKIRVSINGHNCQVQVEDKDKKYAYYTMAQRSDGFKQFVSLILSLSAQNENDTLKNRIILIDEPEVHLHPSGVKYMKNEILKFGKNNHVIVATHSQYMVDTNTPERHWVVQKKQAETSISQINKDTPIEDDEVIASAFGLSVFKELLPENIIIVEGKDDKNIISHSLMLLKGNFFYSIKSAGGASKTPGFARLLSDENVGSFILLDSDKEGRDNKNKIINEQSGMYSSDNTFTLKDLLSSLPSNSTIEDLLPIDFVENFFKEEMEQEFTLKDDQAIIQQIKNQCSILKRNKQKLDSLKVKLSKNFIDNYKTKSKINTIQKLKDLTNALVDKIDNHATS